MVENVVAHVILTIIFLVFFLPMLLLWLIGIAVGMDRIWSFWPWVYYLGYTEDTNRWTRSRY